MPDLQQLCAVCHVGFVPNLLPASPVCPSLRSAHRASRLLPCLQGLRTLVVGNKIIDDKAYQVGGAGRRLLWDAALGTGTAADAEALAGARLLLCVRCPVTLPSLASTRPTGACPARQAWDKRYQEAASSFVERDEKMDALGREIEDGLELIGVTAIEDKLQVGGGTRGEAVGGRG